MNTRHCSALALILLALALPCRAEVERTWMTVLIDGRKAGHLESERRVEGGRITTTERMQLEIERAGIAVKLGTEESSTETSDGLPLAFSARMDMSGIASTVAGTLGTNGKAQVTMSSGGREEKREIDWPKGAVLSEGSRLAERRHGLAPGTRYRVLAFQPFELRAIEVEVEVQGPEPVDVLGTRQRLNRVEQRMQLPGTAIAMHGWVKDDHTIAKSILPLMGLEMELIACDQACALAPNQPSDILENTMVAAPRALAVEERDAGIVYQLAINDRRSASLPSVAEQAARRRGDSWEVTVDPTPALPELTPPTESDTDSTRWMQSEDARLREAARKAVGEETDTAARMRLLEQFVREHISNKSMRIGYASAAETFASREGDCTEHALLLAALARALGIPTRVVNGLAYAPQFAGRENVFVPHAWVQAWTGAEWRSYDAALAGFDGGHIALAVGDGEAAGFYASVNLLGNLRIVEAERLESQ
jgi:hypothetical protein